jgi:hypothetical protein
MPTIRTLQRLVLAGVLSLVTGLASAGINGSPSSSSSGDDDLLLMIVLAGTVISSIDCTSDDPLFCQKGGGFRRIFEGPAPAGTVKMQKGGQLKQMP